MSERTRSIPRAAALGLALIGAQALGCGHDRLMGDVARVAERPLLAPELLDAARRRPAADSPRSVALLVLGREGTEVFDLLAPAEILAASGHFDVFTVAADRGPQPLTGGVAIVPDLTFEEAPAADLVVIPAVWDPDEPALVAWLRARGTSGTQFLSVCEGARLAGAAGLLDGRRVTTHFFALDELQKRHPAASFRPGHRYVADGPLVSTAGVSAAADGALFALERIAGRSVALATAQRLGLEWREESDPEGREDRPGMAFAAREMARLVYHTLLRHRADRMAVLLTPGVSELGLAAALDTFPRTMRVWQTSLSERREPVRTRHGLALIAEQEVAAEGARDLELWLVPSGSAPEAETWARRTAPRGTTVVSFATEPAGRALASQLALLAEHQGEGSARAVARMLELPWPPTVAAAAR